MILEVNDAEVLDIVESPDLLKAKVDEGRRIFGQTFSQKTDIEYIVKISTR